MGISSDHPKLYEFKGSSGANSTKTRGLWQPGVLPADLNGNRITNFPRFKRHLKVFVNGTLLSSDDYTLARMDAPNTIYRYVEITSQDIGADDKVAFEISQREV